MPLVQAFTREKTDERKSLVRFLAGAEGLEPSARGFGADVGKLLARSASRSFQPLAGFGAFLCACFDALLMLCA